jgi:3-oxoacyl-[acyl-carrier protein] reductase
VQEAAASLARPTLSSPTRRAAPGKFELLDDADWDAAVRTLLTSAVGFARAALPSMRARRWGRILNVTSIAARQPVDGLMLSNSVRSAVLAFAKTLSNEVAADGVTVNNLVPGYTRTDRVVDLADQMAGTEGTTPDAISAGSRDSDGRLANPASSRRSPHFWRRNGPATSRASR